MKKKIIHIEHEKGIALLAIHFIVMLFIETDFRFSLLYEMRLSFFVEKSKQNRSTRFEITKCMLQLTDGLKKAHRRNGFVSLSFPQAPVTLFIILCYFESPASTFGFVKAIRLRALP